MKSLNFELLLKYGDKLSYWHCDLFQKFIYDVFKSDKEKEIKAKFIFIDIKALSTTQLNKFLTKLDSNWKDVIIPHDNASSNNLFKESKLLLSKSAGKLIITLSNTNFSFAFILKINSNSSSLINLANEELI